MPDSRFYETLAPVELGELAALTGATLINARETRRSVARAAVLSRADRVSVTYFFDRRHASELSGTRAAACFIDNEHASKEPEDCAALVTGSPQAAWAIAADRLHRPRRHETGAPAIH